MKGKIKFGFRVLILAIAVFAIGISLSFNSKQKTHNVASTLFTASSGEKVSAKFGGDVVFSVEKVGVRADSDYSTPIYTGVDTPATRFFQRAEDGERAYYFVNLHNGVDAKYVVDNGEFVMLEDYDRSQDPTIYSDSTAQVAIDMEQAIMISLGQYVFEETIADNTTTSKFNIATENGVADNHVINARISYLNIGLKVNGKDVTNLPGNRNVSVESSLPYLDFMYLLPYDENTEEGYYEFTINYMKDGANYNETFEFYLLFRSSYNGSIINGEETYYASPTLDWEGKGEPLSDGMFHYFTGKSGINEDFTSYPTITYDYTKYKLTYTHTSANQTTYYDYTFSKLGANRGYLNIVATGAENFNKSTTLNYLEGNINNIASIVLTEMGTYKFNFEYIYSLYNSSNISSSDINLKIDSVNLAIHGFELKYSKQNYSEAQLRYLEISNGNISSSNNGLTVVVPNGYEKTENISSLKNGKLALIYSMVESNKRAGYVVNFSTDGENGTLDAMVNALETQEVDPMTDFSIIDNIVFVKTNQGSMWFNSNDVAEQSKSFYYFSTEKITSQNIESLTLVNYTPQISFNINGYYLVCLNVVPSGLNDRAYWQVFAFEYSTSTVNIYTNENNIDGKVIDRNGYTNQGIAVSWKEPGVFEKAVSGYYVAISDNNATEEELNYRYATSKVAISNGERINYSVNKGHFAKFLIRIESEGQASTSKIVTCDRQAIDGVSALVVSRNQIDNSVYYTLKAGTNGDVVEVENNITDSYATLDWNKKASGAEIIVKYSFTPIIKSETANTWLSYGSDKLLTNTYTLGSTSGLFDLAKSNSEYALDYSNVLSNQGIYQFFLTDKAGNKASYVLVIDKTPAYFEINRENFYTQNSLIFNDSIEYNIGNYKAIELNLEDDNLEKLIEYSANSNTAGLSEIDYYNAEANVVKLSALFKKINNKFYLTVRNNQLVIYNNEGTLLRRSPIGGFIDHEEGKASTNRELYIVGENNMYGEKDVSRNPSKSNSYLDVEINTDNSRTMFYYSENQIDFEGVEDLNGIGNDTVLRLKSDQEIAGAEATSAPYVVVTWEMGSGNYEISKVSYKHYELDLAANSYHYENNTNNYFYKFESETVIYEGSQAKNGTQIEAGRGFYQFGNGSTIAEGLYVVTREYVGEVGQGSNDQKILSYYFIVDRNEIIARGIGENIKIKFLVDDSSYNPTSVIGAVSGTLTDSGKTYPYNVYLTTTKLPLVLQVPAGKYYNSSTLSSAAYYAGKLKVKLFFYDNKNQISSTNRIYEIFNSRSGDFSASVDKNGIININLVDYLGQDNLINKLVANKEDGTWLSLPGRYIVLIEDNVKNTLNSNNYEIFAVDISITTSPTVEVKTGFSNGENVEDVVSNLRPSTVLRNDYKSFSLKTADEHIAITLPEADKTNLKDAQIDVDYLKVTQFVGDQIGTTYTEFNKSHQSGIVDISEDGRFVKVYTDGNGNVTKRVVLLDTMLRSSDGTINLDGLNTKLKYEVTIRYKIDNSNLDFKEAYSYYVNGEKRYCYETTYVIEIDRVAPLINVNNLIESDRLSDTYEDKFNEEVGISSNLFELGYHDSGAKIYFSNEYAAYYAEKAKGNTNVGLIYAFNVSAQTSFDVSDIESLIVTKINDVANPSLSLPIITESRADINLAALGNSGNVTYGDLFSNLGYGDGYYKIEEFDDAGNVSQYVVKYCTSGYDFALAISLNVKNTSGLDQQITIGRSDNQIFTVFSIADSQEGSIVEDYFYVLELRDLNSNNVTGFETTFASDFSTMSRQLANLINKSGVGQYSLTIKNRVRDYTTYINLLDKESVPDLDVDKIVQISNGKYYLVLDAANKTVDGIYYYAKVISVTYNGVISNYEYSLSDSCYKRNDQRVENTILCEDGTYQIKVTNIIDESYSSRRFNTIYGNIFDDLYFDGENGSYNLGDVYYGFTKATLKYDKNIFTAVFVNSSHIKLDETKDEIYNYISIYPAFDNEDFKIVTAEIVLIDKETTEEYRTYTVVIDTQSANVTLKDFQGISKSVVVKMNEDIEDVKTDKTSTGILNLAWTPIENDHFKYTYTLHELMQGETDYYVSTELNDVTTKVISTTGNSLGIYKFEVKVYSLEDVYLGNFVYAFEVQAKNNQAYYVRTESGEAIDSNSTFKMTELGEDLIPATLKSNPITSSNQSFKLYVSNEQLEVVLTDDEGTSKTSYALLGAGFEFTIYRISVNEEYNIYIGLLTIEKTDNVVGDFRINNEKVQERAANGTFTGSIDDEVKVSGSQVSNQITNALTKKNTLLVDVYYNAEENPFTTIEYSNNFSYTVLGNGTYSFRIRDLAGNVHKFITYSNGTFIDKYDLLVLREVVVLVNGEAPIENAYYNGNVEVRIYGSTRYVTGSIAVSATRNGVGYVLNGGNPYSFSEPGTYRVIVSANYAGQPLSRSILFTIINPKEARTAIDLSNLSGYTLKITDINNVDVTSVFEEILNENSSQGMLLTYDKLVEFSEKNPNRLSLTAGKVSFTIQYTVEDLIYPQRTEIVTFSLNDEIPTIDCSVAAGESTTSGFTITFNAGIIYDQVGDAKIYINDEVVAEINENSARATNSITTTFNKNGAGEYYVRLETESGVVLTSFKVTIKEPLNFWAIIIIVAAVLVVGTVVTVIIVLRHKMRIR